MAAESRRAEPPLRDQLLEHSERFEFVQAVRLLAQLYPDRAQVGRDADPREELVRFVSDVSPIFPGGDITEAKAPDAGEPARLTVRFMGVATPGSFGSLSRRYAEEIRALARERNTALRDFLDLFNHRLVSLFYRASERHRPAILCERGRDNELERALAAVLGLGTRGLGDRLAISDRALFSRGGLLSMRPIPSVALEGAVQSVFGVPVHVLQFRAARYGIEPEERNRLGRANSTLGRDLVLGSEVTLMDARFRVRLGPLGFARYRTLLPDQAGFGQLVDLVRLATRGELEFDVQMALLPQEVPVMRLGGPSLPGAQLGYTSWLGGSPRTRVADDAIFSTRAGPAPAEVAS
jgi:type VI secretion system protein ImpH